MKGFSKRRNPKAKNAARRNKVRASKAGAKAVGAPSRALTIVAPPRAAGRQKQALRIKALADSDVLALVAAQPRKGGFKGKAPAVRAIKALADAPGAGAAAAPAASGDVEMK